MFYFSKCRPSFRNGTTHFHEELHFPAFNGDEIDRQQRLVVCQDVFTDCCAPPFHFQFETKCEKSVLPDISRHYLTYIWRTIGSVSLPIM